MSKPAQDFKSRWHFHEGRLLNETLTTLKVVKWGKNRVVVMAKTASTRSAGERTLLIPMDYDPIHDEYTVRLDLTRVEKLQVNNGKWGAGRINHAPMLQASGIPKWGDSVEKDIDSNVGYAEFFMEFLRPMFTVLDEQDGTSFFKGLKVVMEDIGNGFFQDYSIDGLRDYDGRDFV